ncbi:AAA family ATPase [Anabaena sp. UHCC 0253]|uniref:nuclease-related domain-containing DEAD/DEAH box helicase n=1 Tax=Anabaena sp. UHCC 0253 TaxID=2590019 RepID=UPI001445BFE6|nr:NERD domain-containing protein/DEAD/DEAH box helicase [Anabaena sp. UHCC 0253]MTJ53909.1 AAA family ATPase [Anabaena sp. UHCC 0253]
MARMIPAKLSSTTNSYAEKKLFEIFEKDLSDDYIVFHGTWWQHIKYIVQDREADFIILHPDKGILIIEAKGGIIEYDPVNKVWYTNNKKLKISPFQQAKEIKYKFLDFLKKYQEFEKKDFCIGQCVAFPDLDEEEDGLPSEAPKEILLLRPQLKNISSWISSIFDYYSQGKVIPLGENRKQLIINLISPSTKFKKYIGNDIGEIKEEIRQLTEKQFNILNNLCLQNKSIILGCAGSGKTQLAIEKARRLCQHKERTLVICKSNHLSLYLQASLQDEIQTGYCVVCNYEQIKEQNSEIKLEFAAIIVDEGQDFEYQEIHELNNLIPDDGIFYIFQDSNQNISKNANNYALPISPSVLDENCRNTEQIFEYAKPFVKCSHQIKSSFINGRDVRKLMYKDKNDAVRMLEEDILTLVNNENVLPNQIVVLTDIYPPAKSVLAGYSHINQFDFKQYSFSTQDQNTIQWSNIGMFKGLENDVIIAFFEKTKTLIPSNWDITNKYIGATRARSLLIIYEFPDPEIDF